MTIMHAFCTYFDRQYLYKGLTMCRSLLKNHPKSIIWVLCFDDTTYETLSRLAIRNVELIHYSDFEDGELLKAKTNRSRIEYYWTCTPALPLFLLEKYPKLPHITYLDADLYFFYDPSIVFHEFGRGSIFLTEHRYSKNSARNILRNGLYNVQFMIFRNDTTGITALKWWKERCIEWCYIHRDKGKLGDQKYLDDWRERFPSVCVSNHKGIGLAPWNIENYSIGIRNGQLYVDDDILIFFHFHHFSIIRYGHYKLTHVRLSDVARQHIYYGYIDSIEESMSLVSEATPSFKYEITNLKYNIWKDLALSLVVYIRNNKVVRYKRYTSDRTPYAVCKRR